MIVQIIGWVAGLSLAFIVLTLLGLYFLIQQDNG